MFRWRMDKVNKLTLKACRPLNTANGGSGFGRKILVTPDYTAVSEKQPVNIGVFLACCNSKAQAGRQEREGKN